MGKTGIAPAYGWETIMTPNDVRTHWWLPAAVLATAGLFFLTAAPPGTAQTAGGQQPAVAAGVDIERATLARPGRTPEVSTEELRRILAERSATVFDARPFMEFAIGHIPGALNVAAKPGQPMSLY